MAFTRVDQDRTFHALEGYLTCPEIPQVSTDTTPYFNLDLRDILEDTQAASAPSITEVDSQSITTTDVTVGSRGRIVCWKVSAWGAGAVTYTLEVKFTVSGGTTQTHAKRVKIKAL